MANRRMISRSISTSDKLEALRIAGGSKGEFYQLLYTWLIPHTDDWGRMQATAFSIKMKVMPASPRSVNDFSEALKAMHNTGLIFLYGNDKEFLYVIDFDDHQEGLHKRRASKIPEPGKDDVPGNSRKFPEIPGNSRKFRKLP